MPTPEKPLFSKNYFMQKYNVSKQNFERSGLTWDDLLAVRSHFESSLPLYAGFANAIFGSMNGCSAMHSVKVRIKDSEHLLEKIVRKNCEASGGARRKGGLIRPDNYMKKVNDIVGIRVLHLFKDDWSAIHSFILENFSLAAAPCAYVRDGDLRNITAAYEKNGCRVLKHPFGYRSVHYVVFNSDKTLRAEIQVRTLFEEAWSEIDHRVRYPYLPDDEIIKHYSLLLNRLAGSADEISTYIRLIRSELDNMKYDSLEKNIDMFDIIEQKNLEIERLRARLEKAGIQA